MAPAPSNVNVSRVAPILNPVSDTIHFFLLTYALTWVCWIPVVTNRIPAGTFFGSMVWLVGVFVPSLVSLALTAWKEGGNGVRELLDHVLQWQVGARWYLFAIGYMVTIKLTVALAYRVISGHWPRFGHEGLLVMLAATLISTPVQAGEEIGWRGYALPRLGERFGFASGSMMLGLIWACWHLPQFFLMGADTYGQSFPILGNGGSCAVCRHRVALYAYPSKLAAHDVDACGHQQYQGHCSSWPSQREKRIFTTRLADHVPWDRHPLDYSSVLLVSNARTFSPQAATSKRYQRSALSCLVG
jgi:membrane protease YdiL (CAAX protease family)